MVNKIYPDANAALKLMKTHLNGSRDRLFEPKR